MASMVRSHCIHRGNCREEWPRIVSNSGRRDPGDERVGDPGVDVRVLLQGDMSNREAGRGLHRALEPQVTAQQCVQS